MVSNLVVEIAIYNFDLFHSLPLIGFKLASVTVFARVFLKNENILASKVVFRFKYHNGPMAALVGVLCRS